MRIFHPENLLFTSLSALLLIINLSCSGGGTTVAGGGIDGSGIISLGTITAFGSVIVNGTEFDTSNAVIIVDGAEAGMGDIAVLDNLDIGRVVTVEGTAGDDTTSFFAERVIYSDIVKGPVQGIISADARSKEIVVLGQTVILNANTSFKETAFATIAPDDVVEISGLVDDTGTIWATFIVRTGGLIPGLEVEVAGSVHDLDTENMIFKVNNLFVEYQFADTSRLEQGKLAAGMLVEVAGTLDQTGEVLLAGAIEPAEELSVENANQVEIAGFVTDQASLSEFSIGGQLVVTDPDAVFVDGSREDVAPGVKVEAEGTLANGILYAWAIEFWEPDQLEVEDIITDIASAAEFTVGDQLVQTDEYTVFEGGTPDDIVLGAMIEIKGVPIDIERTILIADKVSLKDED